MDSTQSPFDCAARQQIHEHLEAKLRLVSEPFRSVVVLRDIEGFAYEEIAEILKVSLGTVKSRLMRGRAQLKALLAPLAQASGPASGASPEADRGGSGFENFAVGEAK